MTKLNQESGRSMVEMLGVLAIIGVLSIGGIAGYTMAMNRYKANELLNAASTANVLAMTYNQGNGISADTDYNTLLNTTTAVAGVSGSQIIAQAVGAGETGTTVVVTAPTEAVCEAMAAIGGTKVGCDGQTATITFTLS